MALSRERANDLSHRVLEALRKTPGVELTAEAEFVRNRIASALQEWEKESDGLSAEARRRVLARGRRVPAWAKTLRVKFCRSIRPGFRKSG